MEALIRTIEEVRARRGLDLRTAIFDVRVEPREDGWALVGEATDPGAVEELLARVSALGPVADAIVRLPAPGAAAYAFGLVRSAVAPLHSEPRLSSAVASQYVLGHRVDVLSRREDWLRVRGEDGYVGWMHAGYILLGDEEWARAWERGSGGEPVVSLGAELCDEDGGVFARLPWGARVIREAPGRLRLPDGRVGRLGAGEVVEVDRLRDRFPPRGESVVRTARRWIGTPYAWGGVTPAGADCSGYVQSVFWMHGIALPRDSDMQARVGVSVEPGAGWDAVRPGDLLFFAERGDRITHVALSLGRSRIIHSALSAGGVGEDDLEGESEREARLRQSFRFVRRVLPD
ncbi:MAG TPA: NlpC/P60 family protein [Longimicrobiales bacterium]